MLLEQDTIWGLEYRGIHANIAGDEAPAVRPLASETPPENVDH